MAVCLSQSVREVQTLDAGLLIHLYRMANFYGMYLKFCETNSAEIFIW